MPKESWVWKHMKKQENKAVCSLCKDVFAHTSGNGSMIYHLEHVHHLYDPEKSVSTPAPTKRDASGRAVARNEPDPSPLANWATTTRPCTALRAQHITDLLLKCVTNDLQPLSFAQGPGMLSLLQYCEPNYQTPSGTTLLSHLRHKFGVEKNKLRAVFAAFDQNPAVTCDSWTNSQKVGFFSIMVHYLNPKWEIKVYNLGTPCTVGRHTGANIANQLDSDLLAAGVEDFCIVHDNASNMRAGVEIATRKKYNMGCLAHLLSLGVKDAIEQATPIESVIDKVHTSIAKFRRCENLMRVFRKIRKEVIPEHDDKELKMPVETRWNSIYMMLESFQTLYLAFSTTVKKQGVVPTNERPALTFAQEEEDQIRDAIKELKGFKTATDVWEADNHVSISTVYPVLFKRVEKLAGFTLKTPEGEILRDALLQNIKFRFSMEDSEFLSEMSVHVIASFLDPRFKDLQFLNSDELRTKIRTTVTELGDDLDVVLPEPERKVSKKKSKLSQLMSDDDEDDDEQPRVQEDAVANVESMEDEMARYMSLGIEGVDTDPILWWKGHCANFPRLSKIARKYLQIPATSASSERSFSCMGNIFTDKRMSLNPETAEAILFLHFNMLA